MVGPDRLDALVAQNGGNGCGETLAKDRMWTSHDTTSDTGTRVLGLQAAQMNRWCSHGTTTVLQNFRMPPVGTLKFDPLAQYLIQTWVEALPTEADPQRRCP